jgi:predicted SnoaL-like aldol condensation-catalyzing enzyme
MITGFTEMKSRITKTVSAESGNYKLNATAVIEDGRIVSMSGNVTTGMPDDVMGITFDAYRNGSELKVNYHNIASDERETLDIISAMVDAIVERYEA